MTDNKSPFHLAILLLLMLLASTGCTFEIIRPSPPIVVALKSVHGRYITAKGEDDGWALRQEVELSKCGWFTQHHLANGKTALETCDGQYITAPSTGTERQEWMLGQKSKLSDCGQFDLYELGNDKIALKTCAGRFITAGDDGEGWPGELKWSIVGETHVLDTWEMFMLHQP